MATLPYKRWRGSAWIDGPTTQEQLAQVVRASLREIDQFLRDNNDAFERLAEDNDRSVADFDAGPGIAEGYLVYFGEEVARPASLSAFSKRPMAVVESIISASGRSKARCWFGMGRTFVVAAESTIVAGDVLWLSTTDGIATITAPDFSASVSYQMQIGWAQGRPVGNLVPIVFAPLLVMKGAFG